MDIQLVLLSTAFLLGLRHGIDWDHIAAIMDLVSNTTQSKWQAFILAAYYAFGHAAIVITLGLAAIRFKAILPHWLDPIMERFVGLTLLILGIYVFYSLILFFYKKQPFHLKSRWMIIGKFFAPSTFEKYGSHAAFLIGIIHGIGAETATQILLIVAASSVNQSTGIAMLFSFATGLIVSNTAIAILGVSGFLSTTKNKPLFLTTGVLTGTFSLIVGSFFFFGQSNLLPDLQKFLGT